MKTFFDSSAFAKRYIEESGSNIVQLLSRSLLKLSIKQFMLWKQT